MTAEQIRGQQLRQRQTVKMNDRACHANPHDVTHPPLLSSSWKLGPSKSRLIRDTSIPPREFKLRALGRATKVGTTNGKLGSFAAIPVIVSVKRSRFARVDARGSTMKLNLFNFPRVLSWQGRHWTENHIRNLLRSHGAIPDISRVGMDARLLISPRSKRRHNGG